MAHILVIDDDAQVCSVVGEFLRRQGFGVTTACDGGAGLKAAAAAPPDLIICDLDMPNVDGNEVVKALRQDERLGEVPVIFLSGCAERGQVRRSMNLGADDYIIKPAPLPEILEAVKAKLARRQMQIQRQEKRIKKAVDVFVGIIHDLDNAAGNIRWMAETTTGGDGREIQVEEHLKRPGAEASRVGAWAAPAPAAGSLLVKSSNRQHFLKVSEVKALMADGEYSNVHWGKDQRMMFRKPLKQWQVELPGNQFVRVHRRAIVNLAFLDYVDKDAEGNLQVHLREFKEVIPVSQRATAIFNRCLAKYQVH
jgi:CheY-like chemotaxis protein